MKTGEAVNYPEAVGFTETGKEEMKEFRVIILPWRPFREAAFSQPTNSRCLIRSSK